MNRERYRSAFGEALDAQLRRRGVTQARLAGELNVTPSYVNQTISGSKPATPQWASRVTRALGLTDEERRELHRAAARARGYQID